MTRRSGLGRGLDALLPSEAPREPDAGVGVGEVPIDSIDPNPRQPRKSFAEDTLAELSDSIARLGMLQPLLVRTTADDRYELIAGERRLRAAASAGLDRVPVLVVETDDRGSLERALVENIHRADLNPLEEAAAYKELIDEGGLTQEQLGERIGRNRVTIANSLRLLDLPQEVQRFLIDGSLTSAHGRALLGLQGSPFQARLARRVAQEKISVRETEELVRRYQAMTENTGATRAANAQRSPKIAEAQRLLSDRLQTRVRVEQGKRKGKIVVDFATLDELDRLMEVLLGPDA